MPKPKFIHLGLVDLESALRKQEETLELVASGQLSDTIFLLEHPHVFTAGRSGKAENLLSRRDWEGNLLKVTYLNRGGDVTYHGPGQLVGYPIIDLRARGRDVHRFLRDLESALIQVAGSYGIQAFRRQGLTGIWTEFGKLASIGVAVRKWVTMHGFALNVKTDLRYFDLIHPCGIPNCPMASLSQLLARNLSLEEVLPVVESCLGEVFEV